MNFASVVVMQPDIPLLDEPTAQLNPVAAADFFRSARGRMPMLRSAKIFWSLKKRCRLVLIAVMTALFVVGGLLFSTFPGSAAPFTTVYAVSNLIFFSLVAGPIGKILKRIQIKYVL